MVPTAGVPATSPAGTNPIPMTVDYGFFMVFLSTCHAFQTYFQFVQNNFTYINESNIDHIRQEAEERHSQIMEQIGQQLCQDYENRSLNVEQACFNELAQQRANADMRHDQVAAELTSYMMSRTVAEQEIMNLRKEFSDGETEERCECSNQKVSFVARQYEERYSELKMNLTMSHLIEAEFKVHAIDSLAYLAHLRGV